MTTHGKQRSVTVRGTLGAMGVAAVLTAVTGHGVAWCVVMAAMIPAGMLLTVAVLRSLR